MIPILTVSLFLKGLSLSWGLLKLGLPPGAGFSHSFDCRALTGLQCDEIAGYHETGLQKRFYSQFSLYQSDAVPSII